MTAEEKRKKRIFEIRETVRKLRYCDKESIIAECMDSWGSSRRTILEYIKLLINLKKMREEKGILKWGK